MGSRLIVVDPPVERCHQVQSIAAGQLRPRVQPFALQHPAQRQRRVDHELPGDTLGSDPTP
jgi:hypothetical protein